MDANEEPKDGETATDVEVEDRAETETVDELPADLQPSMVDVVDELPADLQPSMVDVVDELPADLQPSMVDPEDYVFPNNNRRRIPGYIYIGIAAALAVVYVTSNSNDLVNGGLLLAAAILGLFGLYCIVAGWNLEVDERDALVASIDKVGFPVGHASAQMGWRGLLSKPTWRILVYSADEPPSKRGLVLVDGVSGDIVEHFVEQNPEDWSDVE